MRWQKNMSVYTTPLQIVARDLQRITLEGTSKLLASRQPLQQAEREGGRFLLAAIFPRGTPSWNPQILARSNEVCPAPLLPPHLFVCLHQLSPFSLSSEQDFSVCSVLCPDFLDQHSRIQNATSTQHPSAFSIPVFLSSYGFCLSPDPKSWQFIMGKPRNGEVAGEGNSFEPQW